MFAGLALVRVEMPIGVPHMYPVQRSVIASPGHIKEATPNPHTPMDLDSTIASKHRPRAHRRRSARSPLFQNRAGLKIVGANDLTNTQCAETRNALD